VQILDRSSAESILARSRYGRLGCLSPGKDTVYVVPISYRLRGQTAYFGSLPGQKLDYIRANPNGVCLEVDQITDEQDWVSVVATGRVEELSGFEYLAEQPAAVGRAARGPLRWTFRDEGQVSGHRLVLCGLRIEDISGRRDCWWSVPESLPAELP
jgi:nitroimidazol reductase NimA-like FMN-containing flavoprotein (pyridoxamine 5'-phosphate oxidase superfamily)